MYHVPLRVGAVTVEGAERTRVEIVDNEIREACLATTAGSIYEELMGAVQRLEGTGVFKSVQVLLFEVVVKLDVPGGIVMRRWYELNSRDAVEMDKGVDEGTTDVTLKIEERGLLGNVRIGTSTTFRPGDTVTAETSGDIINPTGNMERITFSASRNPMGGGSSEYRCRFLLPRVGTFPALLRVQAEQDTNDATLRSSYMEKITGASASLCTHDNRHELSYALNHRDIHPQRHDSVPYAHLASFSIIGMAKPSLKSSLTYEYTQDTRDNFSIPTKGELLKIRAETTLPGGDVTFVKSRVDVQTHIPLPFLSCLPFIPSSGRPACINICAAAGLLRPLGGTPSHLSDRFFVGGPLQLRGFKYAGIGPRAPVEEGGGDEGDALGGDIMMLGSTALSIPFPNQTLAANGMRGELFLNCGNLTTWNEPMKSFQRNFRLSVGGGVVIGLPGSGRLELTFARPIRLNQYDLPKSWQLGAGLTILS